MTNHLIKEGEVILKLLAFEVIGVMLSTYSQLLFFVKNVSFLHNRLKLKWLPESLLKYLDECINSIEQPSGSF